MNDELDAAIDFAHARMADAGNDLSQLPFEMQTVIRIETMQGIIDNGGLQYFYENDFPDNPPYSQFVDDLLRLNACLLYTSPSPRDGLLSRMPSSA